jgi:hypothetical protein
METLEHIDREIQRLQSEALGLGNRTRFLGGKYFDGLSAEEKKILTAKDHELEKFLINAETTVRPMIDEHNKAKDASPDFSMTRINAKIFTQIMKMLYTTAYETEYAYTENTHEISGHAYTTLVDKMKLLAKELENLLDVDAILADKKRAHAVKGLVYVRWEHSGNDPDDRGYDLEYETRHRVPADERGPYAVSGSRSRRRERSRASDTHY